MRHFWASSLIEQPNGCCDVAIPLKTNKYGTTLNTAGFIKSLVLNILFTQGEHEASICGNKPGDRGGHFSTSLSGYKVGTNLDIVKNESPKQALAILVSVIESSLNVLKTYEVAQNAKVSGELGENNELNFKIVVTGISNEIHRINMIHNSTANSWVWND